MMNAILGTGQEKDRGLKILNNVGKQLKEWKIRQQEEMERDALEAGESETTEN